MVCKTKINNMDKLSSFICSNLGAFFIVIPYIKPASEITGKFNLFFNIWKLIAAFIIFICYVNFKKRNKKNRFSLPLLAILSVQVVYWVSTVINLGDIKSITTQLLSNISICVYMIYLFNKSEFLAIKNFTYPTVTMALVVATTMFIYYPNGMYQVVGSTFTEKSNYLWGFDNTSGILFLSTMFFLVLYSLYINKKSCYFGSLIIMIYFFAAFYYVDAITTFFMMLVVIVCYFLVVCVKLKFRFLDSKKVVYSVFFIAIFILLFNKNFTFVWNYLMKIDKYYSIKARFIFFEKEFYYFFQTPFIGCGVESKILSVKKIFIDHPHNYFMDLLYHGGFLALFITIFYFYQMTKKEMIKDCITKLTCICLLVILVDVMLDFYNETYLFYPHLVLTYLILKKRRYKLFNFQICNRKTKTFDC